MDKNEIIARKILSTPDASAKDKVWANQILGNPDTTTEPAPERTGSDKMVSDAIASTPGQTIIGAGKMFSDAALTPGAMLRSGISAAQHGENPISASGNQLFEPSANAPKWNEITSGLSDKPILNNPFGISPHGLATAGGEMFGEPTNYLPLPLPKGAGALAKFEGTPGILESAGNKISGMAEKGLDAIPKTIASVAEATTKIPAKSYLEYAGPGRELVNQMAGKEQQIGEKILEIMDKGQIPEAAQANAIIDKMGTVSSAGVVRALTEAIPKNPTPEMQPIVDKIQSQIDHILEISGGYDKMELPAKELRNQQLQLRETIGDAFGKESKTYVNTLKRAQGAITEELRDEAPGEYKDIMNAWAEKMQTIEKLQKKLGGDAITREDRVANYVKQIFGESGNVKNRQSVISDVDRLFGTDILKEAEAAASARQLGISEPGASASNYMPWKTGANTFPAMVGGMAGGAASLMGAPSGTALLGALGGFAAGSPRLMSGLTRAAINSTDALKAMGSKLINPRLAIPMTAQGFQN